jgi:nucleotide-binding universal stress UspA family protein
MKKILVPTDFSEFSLNAAKLAAQIARRFEARIYFLHVVDMPSVETGIIPGQTSEDIAEGLFILKHVRQQFKRLLNQDFLKGVNVAEAIQFDGVYESILSQCKKHEIDLIVMGTHGSSGVINDYLLGSNTEKVVRLSEIPVLTTREEVKELKFEHIVFASDFEVGVKDAFDPIQHIIEFFQPQVDLVRIVTRDDYYFTGPMLDIMENFAKEKGLKNYTCHVFNAERVQEGINEFALRRNAEIITTITEGRRGLARLFNGSITGGVINSSPFPVLTVKAKK